MRPDKTYKMTSTIKSMVALMKGTKEDKNHFKRMMIDSQMCEDAARRAALRSGDADNSNAGRSRGAVAPE